MIEVTAAPSAELEPAPPAPKPFMPTRGATEDWCTPQELVDIVRRVFDGRIDLDPASNPWSKVGAEREVWLESWAEGREVPVRVAVGDGLREPWSGNVFVNPPYGKTLDDFMQRARRAGLTHEWGPASVIMLVKCATSRRCWQRTVPFAKAVCFIDGRVEFVLQDGTKSGAWFSSALVLWTRDVELAHRFSWYLDGKLGHVMSPR